MKDSGTVLPFWEVGEGMEYPVYRCDGMMELVTNIHKLSGFGFTVMHTDIYDDEIKVKMTKRIPESKYGARDSTAMAYYIRPFKYGVVFVAYRSDDPEGVGQFTGTLALLGVTGRLRGT